MPKFLDMARDAVRRGLQIIPLHPQSKQAVEAGWQTKGYKDDADLLRISQENPDYGVGVLCSKDTTWILDIDIAAWFMDTFPRELMPSLETFTVKTGGGGFQFHFRQNALSQEKLSNKSIPNPSMVKYKKREADAKTVADILFDRKQGLMAGCIHPVTKKEYTVYKDVAIIEASEGLVAWVLKQVAKPEAKAQVSQASPFLLNASWALNCEAELANAGLLFEKFEGDGKIFFNYHSKMGKCLVRGESHAAPGEDANPRQSSFVFDPKLKQLWHQCFSASCEPGIVNTKKALAALGVDWRRVFAIEGKTICELVSYGTMTKQHIRYIWPGYLPENKLIHLAGNSTEGKSPVTVDLAARISAGLPWPDGQENIHGPKKVILLAAEDDPLDTVLPRLELAGARVENVFTIRASVAKEMTSKEKALALDHDLEALLDAIRQTKDLAFIVIDPITNYLGSLSMNKEEEVRRILMPLSTACQELKFCAATVGHLNKKDKGTSPKQRVMGAAAFHGVARFMYFFGPDPEDADRFSHVMVQDRGVGSQSLRYKTVAVKQSWDGIQSDVVKVEWCGFSTATSEDAVDPASQKSKSEVREAGKELREFLKSGRKTVQECVEFLRNQGYVVDDGNESRGGLNSGRVRKAAKAESKKEGPKWYWFIPAPEEDRGMF